MMRQANWTAAFAIALGFCLAGAAAHADSGRRLQAILDAFARQTAPGQFKQVGDALVASPALTAQLNGLAEAGRFTAIDLSSQQQGGTFKATIQRGHIVLAPAFLAQVATRRIHDVVHEGDLLPNNLVFVLGGLAAHLASPPLAMGPDVQAFIRAATRKDARAFVQGWNDVMDAAMKENGGRQPTPQQFASLILNLRYRVVFINPTVHEKIKWTDAGTLEPDEQTISAIARGLEKMQLLDFGVAPGS